MPAGTYSVSTRTGAAQFSYPIAAPPGRGGLTPSLSLTYSSQNPLRGGVAAGWSLGLPAIQVDTSEGRLGATHYMSTLAGDQRLVEVDEPAADDSQVVPYRAEHDATFTRYERLRGRAGLGHWRALLADGRIYYFGETPESRDQPEAGAEMYATEGRWMVTRIVDRFGNEIVFHYQKVRGAARNGAVLNTPIDIALSYVEYGGNPTANIGPHARIELAYHVDAAGGRALETCPGSNVPIGARFSFRNGIRTYQGALRLDQISVEVKDYPSAGWRTTREIDLTYDPEAMRCDQLHAPLRLLTDIREHGFAPGQPEVDAPPLHFEYGPIERSLSQDVEVLELAPLSPYPSSFVGRGKRQLNPTKAGGWPTIDYMWLDLDGDGATDLLRSTPSAEPSRPCDFEWKRNLGGGDFADWRSSSLPTLPWKVTDQRNTSADDRYHREECSLAAQFSRRENRGVCGSAANYTSYRFVDMTGDGRPELVTALDYQRGAYDPAEDPDLAALGALPACRPPPCRHPESNDAIGCLLDPSVGMVPQSTDDGPEEGDDTGGDCGFEQCPAPNCGDFESCPCSRAYCGMSGGFDIPWSFDPPSWGPNGDLLFPGPAWQEGEVGQEGMGGSGNPLCRQTAESACNSTFYVWRIYENLGDGHFAAQPTLHLSPIPLESDRTTGRLGAAALATASSWHGIADLDGDGYQDAIWQFPADTTYGTVDNGYFLVFRGDGQGNFLPDPDGNPYLWTTPPLGRRARISLRATNKAGVAYQTNGIQHRITDTWITLADVNGDGLPDLIDTWRHPEQNQLRVFYNTGTGFEAVAEGTLLADPSELTTIDEETQVLFTKNPDTWHLEQGYSIATRRFVDLDGDGLADVARLSQPDPGQVNPWVIPTGDGAPVRAYINVGDRLLDVGTSAKLTSWRHGLARINLSVDKQWIVKTDFRDFDGDGQADLYPNDTDEMGTGDATGYCAPAEGDDWEFSGMCGRSTRVLRDPPGTAMHLLEAIDNGRGGKVTFAYAPINAVAEVVPELGGRTPQPVWVTTAVTVDPGPTASGTPAPPMVTDYRYGRPVFNRDEDEELNGSGDDRYGFRGFDQVEVTGPANASGVRHRVIERFDYDLDYTGRAISKLSLSDDGALASVADTHWVDKTLFGDQVKTFHVDRSLSYTCDASTPPALDPDSIALAEEYCRQHGAVRRVSTTWAPVRVFLVPTLPGTFEEDDVPGSIGAVPVLWAPRVDATSSAPAGIAEGDRQVTHSLALVTGADRYRLLATRVVEHEAMADGGDDLRLIGKVETDYDDEWLGLPVETRSWIDETTVAVTRRSFDDETGNLMTVKRPRQVEAGSGKVILYHYDPHRIYVDWTRDERGDYTYVKHDVATGLEIETRAPKQSDGWPRALTTRDGLGRVRSAKRTVDGESGFQEVTVLEVDYHDDEVPTWVETRELLDAEDDRWRVVRTEYDGLDRLLAERVDTAEGDAVTTYEYDGAGNVVATAMPDPARPRRRSSIATCTTASVGWCARSRRSARSLCSAMTAWRRCEPSGQPAS